jgi:two-component system, OmpR family, sensor histidine kinase QseC
MGDAVEQQQATTTFFQRVRKKLHYYFFSIHYFLSFTLLTILLVMMGILGVFNYYQISKQNQHIFETQLISSAELLDAMTSVKIQNQQAEGLAKLLQQSSRLTVSELLEENSQEALSYYIRYQDVLIFQVWDTQTNQLLIKSENAPSLPISDIKFGFETMTLEGQDWDSFTLTNETNRTRIIIATRSDFQELLDDQLFFKDFVLLIVFYIITSAIVLIAIQLSLKHLKEVTTEVSTRDPKNLELIDLEIVPTEILPLIQEINVLFENLKKTFSRERRFTADAAHELRTPLAALKTHAEVALRETDPEVHKQAIHKILQGCNRSAHVVEQLLHLSRLDPDAFLEDPELFDLNEITRELIADLVLQALKKNIELSLETPDSDSLVRGNRPAMGILVRNLVDNAIRYSPPNTSVSVVITEHPEHYTLQVIDSGPGVPTELRNRIFDRFYRQEGTKEEGSGLGLSIVRNIIRLHHGKIQALQPASGKGLEMLVTIPREVQ